MADDSIALDTLLSSGPSSHGPPPPLPPQTTYTPVMTPGAQAYALPAAPSAPAPVVKGVLRSILHYVGIFFAGAIIVLPTLQGLILRYIPGAYSPGGTISLTGAAALGALAVVLTYVFGVLTTPLV
jgi:hypothetical protein